ncbi:hypothetical protein D3C83_227970 [compost metagenome]
MKEIWRYATAGTATSGSGPSRSTIAGVPKYPRTERITEAVPTERIVCAAT